MVHKTLTTFMILQDENPLEQYLREFDLNENEIKLKLNEAENVSDRNPSFDDKLHSIPDHCDLNDQLFKFKDFLINQIHLNQAWLMGYNVDLKGNLDCVAQYQMWQDRWNQVVFQILRFIKECQVILQGYRLSAALPPIERIELNTRTRSCLYLRRLVLESCQLIQKSVVKEADRFHIPLDYTIICTDIDDTLDISYLKESIRNIRELKIHLFTRMLTLKTSTDPEMVELLESISKTCKNNVEKLSKSLEISQDLIKISFKSVQRDTVLDDIHLKIITIHRKALMQQELYKSRTDYLNDLLKETKDLEQGLEAELSRLQPPSKAVEINTEQPLLVGVVKKELENEKINSIDPGQWNEPLELFGCMEERHCFEYEAGLESTEASKLVKSTLTREERIELKKAERLKENSQKSETIDRLQVIAELKNVLSVKSTAPFY